MDFLVFTKDFFGAFRKRVRLIFALVVVLGILVFSAGYIRTNTSFSDDVSTVPLPFGSTQKGVLAGAIADGGTSGNVPVKVLTFTDNAVSEPITENTLALALVPNTQHISDGAFLSNALTAGKKIYGYKYSSYGATLERAAAARAAQGQPVPFGELFPGQFFTSAEQKSATTFIPTFETQKGVRFQTLNKITLDRNTRYAFVAVDPGVSLTVHGLPVCGDGIVDSGEACDDGVRGRKDLCSDICEDTSYYWWFDEIQSVGPKDYKGTVIASSVRLIALADGRHALVWTENTGTTTAPLFLSFYSPQSGWSAIQKIYEHTSQSTSHSLFDLNAAADGNKLMIAWSENEYSYTPGHYTTTYSIRSLQYDVASHQFQPPTTLFTNTVDGTVPIGLRDGYYEEYLTVAAHPFSIVWAERGEYFTGFDDQSGVSTNEFILRALVEQEGQWLPATEIVRGRMRHLVVENDALGKPVLFWHYLPEPQPGCQNYVPKVWTSAFTSAGIWSAAAQLNATGWYNLQFKTNPSNVGIFLYTHHCEHGGYSSTNSLYYRTMRDGVLGQPQLLETVSTPGYSGWGTVQIDVLPSGDFHLTWAAQGGWTTPKEYTVTP